MYKHIRIFGLLVTMIFCTTLVRAEILEIYTWKPYAGKSSELLADMQEAAEIHSALGIGVTISALGLGTASDFDYVLSYENMESWGRLNDAAVNDENWTTFFQKFSDNPSGELRFKIILTDPLGFCLHIIPFILAFSSTSSRVIGP